MSQWQQVIELNLFGSVPGIYHEHFPLRARVELAPFLENMIFHSGDNLENYDYAVSCFREVIDQLASLCPLTDTPTSDSSATHPSMPRDQNLLRAEELKNAITFIQNRYSCNPMELFQTLRHCLLRELHLIQSALSQQGESTSVNLPAPGCSSTRNLYGNVQYSKPALMKNMDELNKIVGVGHEQSLLNAIETKVVEIEMFWESIDNHVREFSPEMNNVESLSFNNADLFFSTTGENEQNEMVPRFNQMMQSFKSKISQATGNLQNVFAKMKDFYKNLIIEIKHWKIDQQKNLSGYPMNPNRSLENLRNVSGKLGKGLLQLHGLLIKFQITLDSAKQSAAEIHTIYTATDNLKFEVANLIIQLANDTFVITVQPYQIIRLSTTLPFIELQSLIGNDMNFQNSKVNATLLHEDEVAKLHQDPNYVPTSSIVLRNSQQILAKDINDVFCAKFRSLKSTSAQRPKMKGEKRSRDNKEKSGRSKVTDQKYCFCFETDLCAFNTYFKVRTLSVPVIITCHPNQDANAWATYSWDNCTVTLDRVPFQTPREIELDRFIELLNNSFRKITEGYLLEENIAYLKSKLLGLNAVTNGKISWDAFVAEIDYIIPLKSKQKDNEESKNSEPKASFCSWIYSIMDLVKKPRGNEECCKELHALWKVGRTGFAEFPLMIGFIREDVLKAQLQQTPGAMMLKFSDSIQGGIVVVYNDISDRCIKKVNPFILDDLRLNPLSNKILDYAKIHSIYPNKPKHEVFTEKSKMDDATKRELIRRNYLLTRSTEVEELLLPRCSSTFSINSHYTETSSNIGSQNSPISFGSPMSNSSSASSNFTAARHKQDGGWSTDRDSAGAEFTRL